MTAEKEDLPPRRKRPHWSSTSNDSDSSRLLVGSRQDVSIGNLLVEMRGDAEIWKRFKSRVEARRNVPENVIRIIQNQFDSTCESINKLQRVLPTLHSDTSLPVRVTNDSDGDLSTARPTKRRRYSRTHTSSDDEIDRESLLPGQDAKMDGFKPSSMLDRVLGFVSNLWGTKHRVVSPPNDEEENVDAAVNSDQGSSESSHASEPIDEERDELASLSNLSDRDNKETRSDHSDNSDADEDENDDHGDHDDEDENDDHDDDENNDHGEDENDDHDGDGHNVYIDSNDEDEDDANAKGDGRFAEENDDHVIPMLTVKDAAHPDPQCPHHDTEPQHSSAYPDIQISSSTDSELSHHQQHDDSSCTVVVDLYE